MNLLQEILKSQNGQIVGQLAKQFGLNQSDAQKALSNLIPAIGAGVKKSASNKTGLESLLSKVEKNESVRNAIDLPDLFGKPEATTAGNDILGELFGSKEVSRTVAKQTAKSTGIDLGILKKMLPIIAGVAMSTLRSKGQSSGGGLADLLGTAAAPQPRRSSGLGGLLGSLLGSGRRQQPQRSGLESLLDFDGDGNIADDVLNMAKKLL